MSPELRYRLQFWLATPGHFATPWPIATTERDVDSVMEHLAAVEQGYPANIWSPDLAVVGPARDPARSFKLAVQPGGEDPVGALAYLDLTCPWVSHCPGLVVDPPLLHLDVTTGAQFPGDAAMPLARVRGALLEFAETGQRPSGVGWREWPVF